MARQPGKSSAPPPPPDDDEDASAAPSGGGARDGFKRPSPAAIVGLSAACEPDRVYLEFNLKYGLDNYGSVGFTVGAEVSMKPIDDGKLENTYDRAYQKVAAAFNKRDLEIRNALAGRISDPRTKMEPR